MLQTYQDFDVFVIDNASEDGSAEAVSELFGEAVHVVRNTENVGGAGGFHQATVMGQELGYKYIMLADNDIEMDQNAVTVMRNYLEQHTDVGMVGAKIYLMDEPEKIWIFGNHIDFDKFVMIDGYAGVVDNDTLPPVIDCDTVPACALMIKAECLEKVGHMPKENFIYWDDIEWCYRFKLNGYRIVAIEDAKVWHKTGGSVLKTHFATYYFFRNKMKFFSKYLPEEKLQDYIVTTLKAFARRIYGAKHKGLHNNILATMHSINDFVNNVQGKVRDGVILPYDEEKDFLSGILRNQTAVCIMEPSENCAAAQNAYKRIKTRIQEKYPQIEIKRDVDECSVVFRPCSHVYEVKQNILPEIYVDEWGTFITTEEEYLYFRGYRSFENIFIEMYLDLFIKAVKRLREE